jgi:hypothetical protein
MDPPTRYRGVGRTTIRWTKTAALLVVMVLVVLAVPAVGAARHSPPDPQVGAGDSIAVTGLSPAGTGGVTSSPVKAQTTYPTFIDWNGYDGNATIYPTIYTNNTFLPSENASEVSPQIPGSVTGYNDTWPTNLVTIGTSSPTAQSYYVTSGGTDYQFNLYILAAAAGASQEYTTGCSTQNFSCSSNVENLLSTWTPYQEMSVTTSDLPAGLTTDIMSTSVGLNMTAGNTQNLNPAPASTSSESYLLDIALQLLGVAVPEIGDLLTAITIANDLEGLIAGDGPYSGNGLSDSFTPVAGSGTSNEWAVTENGNMLNASYSCPPASGPTIHWNYPKPNPCAPTAAQSAKQEGQNDFGQSIETDTSSGISTSLTQALDILGDMGSSSSITLGVQNNIEVYNPWSSQTLYGAVSIPGAATSISYPFAPAVSLSGTVMDSSSGTPQSVGGATVTVQQLCGSTHGSIIDNFLETANPQGQWHFFGNPRCSFAVSATASQTFGTVGSPTQDLNAGAKGDVAGDQYTFHSTNLNNYPLEIQADGLGSPLKWSVALQGTSGYEASAATTNNQITFYVPNGTYTATPTPPSSFVSVPTSVSVTVAGTPPLSVITLEYGSTVTFTESGLYSATMWTVSFDGYNPISYGTTISVYLVTNGTYSWSVSAVSGYTASPTSGQIKITGAPGAASVTFTPTSTYTVKFSETGLPSGDSWQAAIGGNSQTAAAGTGISFTGVAGSDSYVVSPVLVTVTCNSIREYAPSPSGGTVSGADQISVTYTLTTVMGPACFASPGAAPTASALSGLIAARSDAAP